MTGELHPRLAVGRRRRRRQSRAAAVVLLAMLVWLGLELDALSKALDVNAALRRGQLADLAAEDSPRGGLAAAVRAQRDGRLDEALAAYGDVAAAAPGPAFRDVLRFNLGNLYLTRAAAHAAGGERELSLSLIEQAKENYRDLLRRDPGHWDARYNLSRALEMLPDLADVHYGDEVNPERAPRAPRSNRAYERLP